MQITNRDLLVALSLLPFLTPNRTRLLLEYFDPLDRVSDASPALLQGMLSVTPEQALQVKNPLTVETRRVVQQISDSVVTLADDSYPPLLREIIDPPLALHFRGDLAILSQPAIAVVGSRRASVYGVNAAEKLTRDLVGAGATIVSGLARGIDGAAHSSALASNGSTIAVLGTGIDVIYPKGHTRLYREVSERGLILSEFAPGTPPMPANFPIRNRVISGLSLGTVIVEATTRSGSLITARMAAEQGREVFAVPGSIFSAGSEGTHRLVQYGAKLVHDVDDILDELPGQWKRRTPSATAEPDESLREVLNALQREESSHVDEIAARTAQPAAALSQSLLQLELAGWIRALPGARYVRVR